MLIAEVMDGLKASNSDEGGRNKASWRLSRKPFRVKVEASVPALSPRSTPVSGMRLRAVPAIEKQACAVP